MTMSNRGFDASRAVASSLTAHPALPKYSRLKHGLREQLAELQPGDPVPTEAELCKAFGVSRTTVRRALSDLVREGLVRSVQGKGSFVAPRKLPLAWVQQSGGMHADMHESGHHVRAVVLEAAVCPSDANIRRELDLAPDEMVIKFVRLRYVDEVPFDICTNFLPAERFPGLAGEDLSDNSLYATLQAKYGVTFGRGIRRIETDLCTAEEAKLIQIKPHSPLLVIYSTMFDPSGRVIEHGIARQRGDRAQLIIEVIPR